MGGLPSNPNTAATTADLYPGYLSYTHGLMLLGAESIGSGSMAATNPFSDPYNAITFMRQSVDENPYAGAEAFDPEVPLAISSEAIDAFEELVATYLTTNPETAGELATLDDFIVKAAEIYNTYVVDVDSDITAEVAIFEQGSLDAYARRRNDFEGAMFDINAIEDTPYVMGLALIAGERVRSLDDLRTKLTTAARRDKSIFLLQVSGILAELQTRNAGLMQVLANLRDGHARWNYAAYREQGMLDIEYDVGEVSWEIESLKEAASIMGAIQGIPMSPKKPSAFQTAVSTALSVGPQVGIAIGNATGNPAIGFAAGGLAALFAYGSNIRG